MVMRFTRSLGRRAFSADAPSLIASLTRHHQAAAEREVKWFLENMPAAYFRQVSERTQERHLRAITALAGDDIAAPEVRLTNPSDDGRSREISFLSAGSGGSSMVLRQLVENVREGSELRRILLFSSRDGRLSLNLFDVTKAGEEEPRYGHARTDAEYFPQASTVYAVLVCALLSC